MAGMLPDFVALYKTRILLNFVRRIRVGYLIWPVLIVLDVVASTGVSIFARAYFMASNMNFGLAIEMTQSAGLVPDDLKGQALYHAVFAQFVPIYITSLEFGYAFFYSTLVTSVWLILILLSTLIVKLLAPLQRFTAWFFNVENHPLQSIGVVAGALVMVGALVWSWARALI